MILQSLHSLYGRLAADEDYELAEPGFSPQKISFRIVLFPDGAFDFHDARQSMKPVRMTVPGDGKRSGLSPVPFFTWDNALYLLGFPPTGRSQIWADRRFEAFRDKHLALRDEIASPAFERMCKFLEAWKPERAAEYSILSEVSAHYGVFQLGEGSRCVHQEEAVLRWWRRHSTVGGATSNGQCLITGQIARIARLHPVIKGITPPKGKTQQDGPLVSVDKGKTAFASYGKEQSFNSPVSEDAAFRYGTALNALLNGPQSSKHRIRIGDATCVFWTDKKTVLEDIFASIAGAGDHAAEETQDFQLRAKIEAFLKALQQGREAYGDLAGDPETTRFYLLGLSPNAARLSVRFFYRSSVRELLDHLRQHKADLEIVREFELPVGKRRADSEFPPYWEFLRETVRQGDDPPPLLGGALMRAILEGTHYPEALLSALIHRVRSVEKDKKTDKPVRPVNYIRAAAIKALLVRNHNIPMSSALQKNHPEIAYHLGRLFAVFEQSQRQAHEFKLDRTIREAFFSSACATPSSVFPRLHKLHVHHLRKLSHGSQKFFEDRIREIEQEVKLAPAEYPKFFDLTRQGIFAIGYYHQLHELKRTPSAEAETKSAE